MTAGEPARMKLLVCQPLIHDVYGTDDLKSLPYFFNQPSVEKIQRALV
jgi:hypothetical protein